MKRKTAAILLLSFLMVLTCAQQASAQIWLGTTYGYVFNGLGATVSGASVTATVAGCSGGAGNGCTGSTTSQANGFFLIDNLNVLSGGTINLQATEGSGSGSASCAADSSLTCVTDIILCYKPSIPIVTFESADAHGTPTLDFDLTWTSGIDPLGIGTTDEVEWDGGGYIVAASPYSKLGLPFGTYPWNLRTCNPGCCSDPVSDDFTNFNNAPPMPTIDPIADTHDNFATVTFASSGPDPDGDGTILELRLDGIVSTPAPPSPYLWSGFGPGPHTAEVRECDIYGDCSGWASEPFSRTNDPPTVIVTVSNIIYGSVATDISVSWVGNDPDTDPLTYVLEIYEDGLLKDTRNPATSPEVVTLSNTFEYRFKVIASDGIDTGSDEETTQACLACTACVPCTGGGPCEPEECPPCTSGGPLRYECPEGYQAVPDKCWEYQCTDWGECQYIGDSNRGVRERTCEINPDCPWPPPELETCTPTAPRARLAPTIIPPIDWTNVFAMLNVLLHWTIYILTFAV
jgi:hypothetical protein